MSRQALVDGNNLATAAYKVKGNLCNSRGLFTGMTLTAIDMLRTMMNLKPDIEEIVVAWDSSPSWRYKFYPEYKANRADKKDDGFDFPGQKARLQVALAYFGIPQIEATGMEADDIAGMWMKIQTHPITFVSNDKDWLQVLQNPLHEVYRTRDKSTVTHAHFERETKGCKTVAELVRCKGIMGESGDNIPGVDGVGPVKALQFLRGAMNTKLDIYKKIQEWVEDPNGFQRSMTLFELGNVPPEYSRAVVTHTPSQFNADEVKRILTDFEANARLAKFEEFLLPFRKLEEKRQERNSVVPSVQDPQPAG